MVVTGDITQIDLPRSKQSGLLEVRHILADIPGIDFHTFSGADVSIEALVPESVRTELAALGHEVTTVPPRTGTFGHGQAVMSDGSGVHFGASEPRHDGAAIPEASPQELRSQN